MATKALTQDQVNRLDTFVQPFIQDNECSAEAAIRKIQELERYIATCKNRCKGWDNDIS